MREQLVEPAAPSPVPQAEPASQPAAPAAAETPLAPSRAGGQRAKGFARLPLWLRVAAPLVAMAAFYHYWQPLSTQLNHALGISGSSRLDSALSFYIYEVIKVFILLVAIVFLVGVVRSFFSPERTRGLLRGRRELTGNVMAAGLGIVTPFCSCSAVPLFIGFLEAGIPLGVTFSFLIAAPMINEVAVVLLFGMFGWSVAGLYISTGLAVAIIAGIVIGRLGPEHYLQDWVRGVRMGETQAGATPDWAARVRYGLEQIRLIVGKVWPYILIGIGVGAAIHGYVPTDFMASFMGPGVWWSVPVAVLLGVPLYSNAAGIIPIVQALIEKGAALGTVLAFMMSVIAISLPEAMILRRVLKWQLIAIFFGTVTVGILLVGFLFNVVLR
jgi:uncharacterized membrane protein YraQ (UPF0718 family)